MKDNQRQPSKHDAKTLSWRFDGECIRCLSHWSDRDGYPHIMRRRRKASIARHLLFRRYGVQPTEIVCRHTCDHPWCINPNHIVPGTHQQNVADRVLRGRTSIRFGGDNSHSKLTEDQVRTIRTLSLEGFSQIKIARMFNVSKATIWCILHGRSWSHL